MADSIVAGISGGVRENVFSELYSPRSILIHLHEVVTSKLQIEFKENNLIQKISFELLVATQLTNLIHK